MKFKLEIEMGNAAFENANEVNVIETSELKAILNRLQRTVLLDFVRVGSGKVLDTNGNTVGAWEISE